MNYRLITPALPQANLSAIERVLTNRGIKLSEIERYINFQATEVLDPSSIKNIREGAVMLVSHIKQNDKILIQVDSDCDGMTSTALLINYLNCLFPSFTQNNISYRLHKGKQHGLILDTIPKDVKLVIAPDASSNDYEEHEALKKSGIDVLVIDHHEADKVSEYACVINNQLCDYPTKSLSGVGMVFKFCSYLDQLMGSSYVEQYYDLVSLGLIADMVDLRDFETRYLVNKGLMSIRNPFFKAMVSKQEYSIDKNGGLNPHTVGFYIAPYINAITRVGEQSEKLVVFEAMLDFRGYEPIPSTKRGCKGQMEARVEQACRTCTNVKNRQTKSIDGNLDIIKHIIEEKDLLKNKILVLKLKKEYSVEKNITGLVANKLMSEYQRPVLILNENQTEEGEILWEGSGRAPSDTLFAGLRTFLKESGLAYLAEGHENALGVGIKDSDIDAFIQYANEKLKDFDFTPSYKVDLIWDNANFNPDDILSLASYDLIWGQEIAKPLVAIENIKVHSGDLQLMKGSTLKITLTNGTSLIKFGSSEEEYEELYSDLGCVTINVVGECKRNVWNGKITPQIEIKEYEIVGTTKYYF